LPAEFRLSGADVAASAVKKQKLRLAALAGVSNSAERARLKQQRALRMSQATGQEGGGEEQGGKGMRMRHLISAGDKRGMVGGMGASSTSGTGFMPRQILTAEEEKECRVKFQALCMLGPTQPDADEDGWIVDSDRSSAGSSEVSTRRRQRGLGLEGFLAAFGLQDRPEDDRARDVLGCVFAAVARSEPGPEEMEKGEGEEGEGEEGEEDEEEEEEEGEEPRIRLEDYLQLVALLAKGNSADKARFTWEARNVTPCISMWRF